MIHPKVFSDLGVEQDGILPGTQDDLPITYIAADFDLVCVECANGGNKSLFRDKDMSLDRIEDKQWIIVDWFVYMEGPDNHCSHCGKALESFYG